MLGFWCWVLGFGVASGEDPEPQNKRTARSPGRRCALAARMAGIKRPEDFDVWKLGWQLKRRVFAFTATSPASQDRRFCDDIRRAARSGPDLVAEGYYRFNPREFHRFLNDAKGSLGEVRNQLMHAKDERFVDEAEFSEMDSLANRAIGAANALQRYLRSCPSKFTKRATASPKRARLEPGTKNHNPEPQKPELRTARSTYHRF